MAVSSLDFKRTLRHWASGVTVVSSGKGDERHGMTVSAFASVSAEPPQVLVCINRDARTFGVIEETGRFAVNILAEGQDRISNHFAASDTHLDRFAGIAWSEGPLGLPLIDGALATLCCEVTRSYDEGTHRIYIGAVEHVATSEGAPLLHYDGGYRELD